jgi:hypothetical protein
MDVGECISGDQKWTVETPMVEKTGQNRECLEKLSIAEN